MLKNYNMNLIFLLMSLFFGNFCFGNSPKKGTQVRGWKPSILKQPLKRSGVAKQPAHSDVNSKVEVNNVRKLTYKPAILNRARGVETQSVQVTKIEQQPLVKNRIDEISKINKVKAEIRDVIDSYLKASHESHWLIRNLLREGIINERNMHSSYMLYLNNLQSIYDYKTVIPGEKLDKICRIIVKNVEANTINKLNYEVFVEFLNSLKFHEYCAGFLMDLIKASLLSKHTESQLEVLLKISKEIAVI